MRERRKTRCTKLLCTYIPVIFLGNQFYNSIREFLAFLLHSLYERVGRIVSISVDLN